MVAINRTVSSFKVATNEGNGKAIHNDVLDNPGTGSALKVDEVKPIYKTDPITVLGGLLRLIEATKLKAKADTKISNSNTNNINKNLESQTPQNQKGNGSSEGNGVPKTGTVWDDIKPTQSNIEGTNIPKSFELGANGKKYWVNPNGTKHMAEYSTRTLSHGQKMTEQQLLSSLQGAVSKVTTSGYTYDVPIKVGNWELIFSPARQAGQLPVIKHALYIP